MSYTPPVGSAVPFIFVNPYTPPVGSAVPFVFGGSIPPPPPGSVALPKGLSILRREIDDEEIFIRRRFTSISVQIAEDIIIYLIF